jgi:hypothetical protein
VASSKNQNQEKSMVRTAMVNGRFERELMSAGIVLGVIAGFFAWAIVWVGSEKILSAIWPEWFQFAADTTILLIHIILGSIVSVMSGSLAALIAGENKRAPLILGFLLLAFGLLKVVMSWPYVPIWYHVIFTAILIPMTIMGGKLKTTA